MSKRIKRTTELTIERNYVVVAGGPPIQRIFWCPECLAQALLVTPEEAGSLSRVSVREIFRRVEAGRVHFVETCGGQLYICANSL